VFSEAPAGGRGKTFPGRRGIVGCPSNPSVQLIVSSRGDHLTPSRGSKQAPFEHHPRASRMSGRPWTNRARLETHSFCGADALLRSAELVFGGRGLLGELACVAVFSRNGKGAHEYTRRGVGMATLSKHDLAHRMLRARKSPVVARQFIDGHHGC